MVRSLLQSWPTPSTAVLKNAPAVTVFFCPPCAIITTRAPLSSHVRGKCLSYQLLTSSTASSPHRDATPIPSYQPPNPHHQHTNIFQKLWAQNQNFQKQKSKNDRTVLLRSSYLRVIRLPFVILHVRQWLDHLRRLAQIHGLQLAYLRLARRHDGSRVVSR